jgi:phenylalanyl-tRNA synthetase beta chain
VVDVTNYVMLECGQPLHAFDLSLLHGGTIIVRQAGRSKSFVTLDGKEHRLPLDAVMVCDAEREVSIAGIMGGANSEINEATTDIVLESAYWNPSSIRRTRKALGIVTDASQRFERGADPNGSDFALARAASLIMECAGGVILKGVIDVYPHPVKERRVQIRVDRMNSILGTSLSASQTVAALKRLGVRLSGKPGARMTFSIPTYRVDLEREIDLIEEVARVHGYDNIGIKTTARIDFDHPFPKVDPAARLRDILIGFGYQEAITNSLQSEAMARGGSQVPARLANQMNQEMSYLRTSLLPGLLDVVALNQSRGNTNLRLFEIGHVFSVDETKERRLVGKFVEQTRVALVMTGLSAPRHWSESPRAATFFDLKGDIADLLTKIDLDKGRFISYSTTETLAAGALAIEIHGGYAGHLGSVRSDVLKRLGIEQDVFVVELDFSLLSSHARRRYKQLPRFPRVRRDLAFVLDGTLSARAVEEAMWKAASELLASLELFDVFEGKSLPPGKKSLAFSLELMSPVKTLTDAEIDAEVRRIVEAVERTLGASLRTV